MSDGTAALAGALAKVQAELPKVERDRTVEVQQKNGGTYSYSYVTLANLSDAVLPLIARHGLAFTAMPGAGSDGKMCLRYQLLHESGESLSGEFPISGEGGIQMIGGRITYARRYCLAALVGVAADEDDESRLDAGGGTAQRARPQPRKPRTDGGQPKAQRAKEPAAPPPLPGEGAGPDPITRPQLTKLAILSKELELDQDRATYLAYLDRVIGHPVESSKELTKNEAHAVIDVMTQDRDNLAAATAGQPAGDPAPDTP